MYSRLTPVSQVGQRIDRSSGHAGIASVGALAVAAVQGMGVEAVEADNQAGTKFFSIRRAGDPNDL